MTFTISNIFTNYIIFRCSRSSNQSPDQILLESPHTHTHTQTRAKKQQQKKEYVHLAQACLASVSVLRISSNSRKYVLNSNL